MFPSYGKNQHQHASPYNSAGIRINEGDDKPPKKEDKNLQREEMTKEMSQI